MYSFLGFVNYIRTFFSTNQATFMLSRVTQNMAGMRERKGSVNLTRWDGGHTDQSILSESMVCSLVMHFG